MRHPEVYFCDGCGKQKQSVNHWYLLSVDGGLHLDKWVEDSASAADKHLCGAECVTKAVSEWMQGAANKEG